MKSDEEYSMMGHRAKINMTHCDSMAQTKQDVLLALDSQNWSEFTAATTHTNLSPKSEQKE